MVVVNFPHNPTGATLSPEQQLDLVQRVARSGAYLLWDGACEDLAEKADRLPCPNSLYDRSISLGTLSKSFGAPGLRVGWLAASDGILRRCVQLRDYLTLHLSPLIERIALSVLRRPEALLELRWRQVTKNLQVLAQWVEEHQPGVEWVKPKGGVCSFPRLPVSDVEAFCHRLARQQGVLLVPGTVFGCPRAVRLGFGTSTHELKIGLAKLSEALSAQQRGAVS